MKNILFGIVLTCFLLCACTMRKAESLLTYVDTRIGTAASITKTAGLFGKKTEEYGQVRFSAPPYGRNGLYTEQCKLYEPQRG